MKTNRHWLAALMLAAWATLPAMAVVVLDENFEDDVVDDSGNFEVVDGEQFLIQHLHTGPPTNVGKPGTWIPNQYDVDRMGFTGSNGEWFDPTDVNPDTDWQFAVIKDLRKVITLTPGPTEIRGARDTSIPERPGNEGFVTSHHQGDCSNDHPCGIPGQASLMSIRLNRAGFIKFSDATGTPVIAEEGDTLRFAMDFSGADGNTAIAFTNNIDEMVARTADEELNPPYSKWAVGFGQELIPLQPDLGGWQGHVMDPHVVIQVEFISGFNQEYLGSRLQNAETVSTDMCLEGHGTNCSRNIELVPDTDQCVAVVLDIGQCGPLTDPDHMRSAWYDDWTRYQHLELEYTVGEPTYKMWLDGVEVSTQYTEATDSGGRDVDQEWGLPLTVSQLPFQIDGVDKGLIGEVQIDGLVIGATGDRGNYSGNKNSTSLVVDDLCVTINQALDGACFNDSGGPTPLLGDANNDDQVTGADLIAVQQNFGNVDPSSPSDGLFTGDANDDGQVTGADLIAVQQNFGNVAAAAPVPEPATAALLAAGLGLLAATGRRRPA